MTTDFPLVHLAYDGDVALATLQSPPANALGLPLIGGLNTALDEFEQSGSTVLVINSALTGFFAAGADLKYISTLDAESLAEYRDALRTPLERIAYCGRPSIAVIDGIALGGGLELAMACTLRYATAAARLGLPEVKLGLLPGAGGTQRLPRLVGAGRALQLMLTGEEIDGEQAARIGLTQLAEGDSALPAALGCAGTLARLPAAAISAIITCVDAAIHTPAAGMEIEGEAIAKLFAEGHADAGIAAFLERVR